MNKCHGVIFGLMATVTLSAGTNLLPNGNFDAGTGQAEFWEKPDGLTSFWVDEPGRGRVLKLDSRIDRLQALAWMANLKQHPNAVPPAPIIPKEPLKAIGGTEGVMLDSTMIEVKLGQDYKLSVDYRGKYRPFVWIKGFMVHPRRKVDVDAYQTRLEPDQPSENEWRTFSIGFNPTARMPKVSRMKVRVYAYWPVGEYYFDNIRIEEITPAEMAQLVKVRNDWSDRK